MQQAIKLAATGLGHTSPNPMVGAVIVDLKNQKIIASGFHQAAGKAHAEVNALNNTPSDCSLSDKALFVTLEPCNHTGRTPPCTEAILASGIQTVVIGAPDVNPLTAGTGSQRLRQAGINVIEHVCRAECITLNKRYYVHQLKKRPFIILKWAETVDGFIARPDGSSKWMSSEEARVAVHELRSIEDAILVGSTTAIIDNPALTVRHVAGENPIRIVLDSNLRVPTHAKIFNDEAPGIIFNATQSSTDGNNEFVAVNPANLDSVLATLHERGVTSILVEGGAKVLASFIRSDLWDEALRFVGTDSFGEGVPAPELSGSPQTSKNFGTTTCSYYTNQTTADLLAKLSEPTIK